MRQISTTLLLVSFLSSSIGLSQSLAMVIDRGAAAFPSPIAEKRFAAFMESRRAALMEKIPGLMFQNRFSNGAEMMRALDSRVSGFVNREHHCSFLRKLAAYLDVSEERLQLSQLTRDGQICIAGDLPADDQASWALSVQRLIWLGHWLPYGTKRLNAEELIATILQDQALPKVELKAWKNVEFDATFASLSSKNREFIHGHDALRRLADRFKAFDINNSETIPAGSARMYATKNLGHIADVFYDTPTIWISPSTGPADSVDALFHEFGHLIFDLGRENFSVDGNVIRYSKEQLLDETCAESFAWIMLRRFYEQFPEIEFSHVFKSYGFSQIKRSDPHYTGSAAVFDILRLHDHDLEVFRRLLKAQSLSAFLLSENLEAVVPTTNVNRQVIHYP